VARQDPTEENGGVRPGALQTAPVGAPTPFTPPRARQTLPPTTANRGATHGHLVADRWGPLGFPFSDLTNMIPVLGSGKISRKRIKIRENLGWWKIQFGTLLIIATSSKSSRILNYFKDSESNLV
jgi:hypothetical protein